MPRFKTRFPLRSTKRQARARPHPDLPLPNSYEIQDIEKRKDEEHDEDDDSDSDTLSSPTNYDYREPMLGQELPPLTNTVPAYAHKTSRRRCNLYFALGLGSTIILFILYLSHSTYTSRQDVASGLHIPISQAPLYENFPFLKRYHGGIRTLVSRANNIPEYPDDKEDTLEMLKSVAEGAKENGKRSRRIENYTLPAIKPFNPFVTEFEASAVKECFLDETAKIRIPKLHAYDGVVRGFPDNIMGSYELLGLNGDVCFERYGRLGPYGYGYSQGRGGSGAGMDGGDNENSEQVWAQAPPVDFRGVNWAEVQTRCLEKNQARFRTVSLSKRDTFQEPQRSTMERAPLENESKKLPRQAVVIRTWTGYEYDQEDIMYFRALIAELALASGGEYDVHFLVHVKDTSLPIWSDNRVYLRVLSDALPPEFREMGTLWSEKQMESIYTDLQDTNFRGLGVWGVYRSTYLPLQFFAHQHPEYDFFWHWEVDIRYTGHFYHLFNQVGKWAKEQPRKGLWERNARFYVPSVHGTWEDFRQMVRVQTEHGTSSLSNLWNKLSRPGPDNTAKVEKAEKPIWGPELPLHDELDLENDPKPPTTYDKDKYEWGVGEEADFITFNPLFDPDQTGWNLAEDVTGYNLEEGFPPRRTAIITASRLSKNMLDTMHRETAIKKHTMFSEMWPGSCALHHGLKAVYAPHPVFIDRNWPTDYLAAIFNGGRNGASGGARTTPFNDENQRNFLGVTWYYHAGFAPNLFHRWLGFNVDGEGGPTYELENEGRMCLPGLLLHPVKQVDLVYEKLADKEPVVDDEGSKVVFGPGD